MIIFDIWNAIPNNMKSRVVYLGLLIIVAAMFEALSVVAVFPLLYVIINPRILEQENFSYFGFSYFNNTQNFDSLTYLTATFVSIVLLTAILRLVYLKFSTDFAFRLGHIISVKIFSNVLGKPYERHLLEKSNILIDGISVKISKCVEIFNEIFSISSAALISFIIITVVVIISPTVATGTFIFFVLIYGLVYKISRSILKQNSDSISKSGASLIHFVRNCFGSMRDIVLSNTKNFYVSRYTDVDNQLRAAQSSNWFISRSPRFIIESFGFVVIAILTLFLTRFSGSDHSVVPTIGLIALSAQRLLPLFQQIFYGITFVKGNESALTILAELSDRPKALNQQINENPIGFSSCICLSSVSYTYPAAIQPVLENINFFLRPGERIGIVGKSGGGKSTFIDLLMGLLSPKRGTLSVDGVVVDATNVSSYQQLIAHVPQHVFIIDGSLKNNIALGEPTEMIDEQKIRSLIQSLGLEVIMEMSGNGIDTLLGEGGLQPSGGQRQRIGIARALYRNPRILILDEATSALDSGTEEMVLSAISTTLPEVAVVAIAHRTATLRSCNRIFRITNRSMTELDCQERRKISNAG